MLGGAAQQSESAMVVHLGTAVSLQKRGLVMPPDLEASLPEAGLESRVYLGWEGQIRAVVRLQDHLRSSAASAMNQCRALGIEIHMLSGDRAASTQQVAAELGIRHWAAERLPWQKVEYIESLERQGRKVAMVGDGLNDAPALAKADVGITHQIGTDLTKEAADVHILAGDIALVPWVLSLSKKTFRHIQLNLFWAFLYNIIAIALAAIGWLRPVMAAAAMLVSSLIVVGNSLRLEKVRGLRAKKSPRKSASSPADPLPATADTPQATVV